jgi:hypothetical protein
MTFQTNFKLFRFPLKPLTCNELLEGLLNGSNAKKAIDEKVKFQLNFINQEFKLFSFLECRKLQGIWHQN